MSEKNTNDVVPAVLAEGEAVIPTEKVEEFETLVEEIVEAKKEDKKPEPVKVTEDSAKPEPVKVETKVEKLATELNLKPQVSVVEEPEQKNVVSSGSQKTSNPSDLAAALTGVANGVIGTGSVKRKPAEAKKAKPEEEKVAIHSTKNVSWVGVGKINKGFNIVHKDHAEKWLERDHTRLVSPEELAQGYEN